MGKDKFSDKHLKFVQFLITENIVAEQLRPANENSTTPYLVKGNNASKLVDKELCFYFYKHYNLLRTGSNSWTIALLKNYSYQSTSVLYYNYILMLKFTNLRTVFICNN